MPLIEEMEVAGRWLFRWRSYLPLATVILLLVSLEDFAYPFGSHWWDQAWEVLCLGLSFLGLGVRILTVGYAPRGTSGRNMKRQMAEQLNTTGAYSVVRNPLYLGNFLIGLGIFLFPRVWLISLVYALLFIIYYERIIFAEEVFLRREFGRSFEDWAAKTPAFLPRLRRWKSSASKFNLRKVCRHEHQTLFLIIIVFYALEVLGDYIVAHELFADMVWNAIAILATVLFIATRILRKYTSLLMDREPKTPDSDPSRYILTR